METNQNLTDNSISGISGIFGFLAAPVPAFMAALTKLHWDAGDMHATMFGAVVTLVLGAGIITHARKMAVNATGQVSNRQFFGVALLAAAGTFAATEYAFGSKPTPIENVQAISTDSIQTASLEKPNMPKFVIK